MEAVDVAVVGAGPAGLFAAERCARSGLSVAIFDKMPSPARKFLIAGRGGLNLTHSEPLAAFLPRYGDAAPFMAEALARFSPDDLQAWARDLGEETFVGSSGRVFPKSFKASPLLRAWLRRLEALHVALHTRHSLIGLGPDGRLRFATPEGERDVKARAILLALGGASWPRLGSAGDWVSLLTRMGVAVAPFAPANAGWLIGWSPFVQNHAGTPLKRIALSFGGETVRGDAMLTRAGLEGGPVYALGARLRGGLARGESEARLDLRPDLATDALARKLARARKGASLAKRLTQAGLSPAMQAVLREAGPLPDDGARLAAAIKAVPLRVRGLAGLDRAISSAGGIPRDAVDDALMLRAVPGVFVAGEMLDWEAPTGGYLLQGCFATAARAAAGIVARLGRA